MTIFEIGETKSGYKFLDVLKRSSHSVEYRVQNTLAQRLESMKVLSQLAAEDVQGAELFLREVRVRARLIHPNIVTLFSAIELDRRLAMTTELVEGPTLAECLQSGPLPWREAVRLAGQALSALSFAHRQHVVHRDINPENIVIAPGGVLKLTNFALAKSEVSPKLTQVGAIVGNLKCISPEQVKGTGEADARSDLYSLGVVLFEMICGRPPFESRSQFELMTAHVNQPPPRPSEWNCTIPPEIDEIVLKSLAKDPACRYQTASEFAEALVQAVAVIDRLYPAAEPAGEEVCPVPLATLQPAAAATAGEIEAAPVKVNAAAVLEPPRPMAEVAGPAVVSAPEPVPELAALAAAVLEQPIAMASPAPTAPAQTRPAEIDAAPAETVAAIAVVEPPPPSAEPAARAAEADPVAVEPAEQQAIAPPRMLPAQLPAPLPAFLMKKPAAAGAPWLLYSAAATVGFMVVFVWLATH